MEKKKNIIVDQKRHLSVEIENLKLYVPKIENMYNKRNVSKQESMLVEIYKKLKEWNETYRDKRQMKMMIHTQVKVT